MFAPNKARRPVFFEDAIIAAEALDIALTKRGKHLGEEIPMCGVPHHSHEQYLARLIRKGYVVALCEQVEDPALRLDAQVMIAFELGELDQARALEYLTALDIPEDVRVLIERGIRAEAY